MKKWLVVMLATLGLSSVVSAQTATNPWTKTVAHSPIYSGAPGANYATMAFTPSGIAAGRTIAKVEFLWNPYPNGNTQEDVQICFTNYPGGALDCNPVPLPASTAGIITPTNAYNGKDARSTISIRHTLTGGTYPANAAGVSDTVWITWQ
ncbi:MAG: hypothetical protein LBV49_02455 [Azonexus sp.]|jgi:hypothetical protein|nr:hypothetical protein [Azonexus sp.]